MKRHDIRLLIIDRNPHVRDYLQREFRQLGYEVSVARTCSEVQQEADSEHAPHLVVIDPELPGQNGYFFLEGFRKSHLEIPLIVHTFSIDGPMPAVLRNADALVEKSGDFEALKRSVEKVLSGKYPGIFQNGSEGSDAL